MFSGIFKWFGGANNQNQPNQQAQTNNTTTGANNITKQNAPNKTWKKEVEPIRNIRLWGWDSSNNPSFLVLYGKHEFAESELLEDDVTYTSYIVWNGKEGHLPAFEAVKIFAEPDYYDRKNEKEYPKMFYKKGLKSYWKREKDAIVKEFTNLGDESFSLPYFVNLSYEQLVEKILAQKIDFQGFKLAQNPNEILQLDEDLSSYYYYCCYLFSHDNIYMRKKFLNKIIMENPPDKLYKILFKLGSTELLAGLFLQLAQTKNDVLLKEATQLIENQQNWSSPTYIKGLKRCAQIYVDSLNPAIKEQKLNWLKENHPQIDLTLININGKSIPSDKILEGSNYRKYALQGLFSEFTYYYNYEKRQSFERKRPEQFKRTFYSDGNAYDFIKLKNTIQECEVFGCADILGKIAYYLDAPRLTYYAKGTGKGKALSYYRKYVRRIIDGYAKTQPDKFMQAMKALFTSYTPYDYTCKFKGNFQFSYYIRHYLYNRFDKNPPQDYYGHYQWMIRDQLMKARGRFEMMPEIWDNHLNDVLDIAANAQIETIQKACYFILQSSTKKDELVENMSYNQLINLTQVSYDPLAKWFTEVFKEKIEKLTNFDFKLMLELLNSPNPAMHEIAIQHFTKTNGEITPTDAASLLLLNNIERWSSLFEQNIYALTGDKYIQFIETLVDLSDEFTKQKTKPSKEILDLLSLSSNHILETTFAAKTNLVSNIITTFFEKQTMPDWLESLLEEVIFAINYDELTKIVNSIDIKANDKAISVRCRQIFAMLECVKQQTIPSDAQIVSILETGTAKIITTLFTMVSVHSQKLHERYATLLIMAESDITTLNNKVKELFDLVNKQQQERLHKTLLDSPVKKVYMFALEKLDQLYGDMIPEHFIKQLMEHTASEVKSYISDKTNKVLDNLENSDIELFMYYMKTLLLLPNKVSKSKDKVYSVIPLFAQKYTQKAPEIEEFLLDIGGSNLCIDAERALITLAQIKKEAV